METVTPRTHSFVAKPLDNAERLAVIAQWYIGRKYGKDATFAAMAKRHTNYNSEQIMAAIEAAIAAKERATMVMEELYGTKDSRAKSTAANL
jgi:protein-disulfide isomerase-like protein with CxxC motif